MEPLAAEFERAVRQDVEHVKKVSSYRPSYYLQMLANDGAVATAKKLVLAGSTHEGFARLWELDLLDRSIEAAMIRPEFSQLFTADELEAARSRLRAHGVDVDA